MRPVLAAAAVVAAASTAALAWGLAEAHAFTTRRVHAGVLPAGSAPLTVLHVSDLHLVPSQRDKIAWVRSLAQEQPDLVVVTGDNLAHADAVPAVAQALEPLLRIPGLFVFGSNDYFAPQIKNPFTYFTGPSRLKKTPAALPTESLRELFTEAGWHELNNARARLTVGGLDIATAGLDDPHIRRDKMPPPAESEGPRPDVSLGVVHAPYARALRALRADGADMIFAGHTHGGQVCLPGFGALVTNCDLDRRRAKGLSAWPGHWGDRESIPLHVSAGAGTSPFAPVRFACRPEATVVTLTAVDAA